MSRKQNSCGVPIFSDLESDLLHAEMISRPCASCGAKRGFRCLVGRYVGDGQKDVYDPDNPMPPGTVHMGRLPRGWDSARVVDEALAKMFGTAQPPGEPPVRTRRAKAARPPG
jgi:hypothetical protein